MNEEERNKRDEELWYICENYLFMDFKQSNPSVLSTELVKTINIARLYESGYDLETSINIAEMVTTQKEIKSWNTLVKKNKIKGSALIRHDTLKSKIDDIVSTLKAKNFNDQNFWSLDYKDKKGEIRQCYKLNKNGIRMILSSESYIIQHILITYLSYLEEEYLIIPEDYYTIGYLWHLGYRQYFDTELLKRTAYKLGRTNVQEEGSNGKIYNAYHKDVYLNAYGIEL